MNNVLDAFERIFVAEVTELHCKLIHALKQCVLLLQREMLFLLKVSLEFS